MWPRRTELDLFKTCLCWIPYSLWNLLWIISKSCSQKPRVLSSIWAKSVYRICYVCHYPYRLYILLCSLFSVCIYSVMASSALDQNTLTLDTCSLFLSQILFEDDHVCGRSEAPSKNSFSISIFKAQKGLLCLYIFKAIHDDLMCVAAVFSKHDMDEYVVCLYVYITSKYIYNLYMWSLSLCSRYSYSEPFCIFKIVQKRPHVLSSSEIRRI